MGRPRKYSPEVRERAVRLVFDHEHQHESQWAAIRSVAEKIECTSETLRHWVRQAERDTGRQAEHGRLRVKNSPALAGHGAEAVRDAITSTIATLPEQLRRSLTWDQGAEMAQHARLRIDSGLHVFFCDPRSPWQRATNENTTGLLRQYFPKGTDLSRHSARDIAAVAATLNGRPRKTLSWRTPSEVFNELLLSHP